MVKRYRAHKQVEQRWRTAFERSAIGINIAPDCLILDIRPPGMSGLELQRCLTATGDVLTIIFATAGDEVESRSQALEGGN